MVLNLLAADEAIGVSAAVILVRNVETSKGAHSCAPKFTIFVCCPARLLHDLPGKTLPVYDS